MYICLCNGVTDTDILEAAENGHTSIEALHEKLGVGTNCGSCISSAMELIENFYDSEKDPAIFYKVA